MTRKETQTFASDRTAAFFQIETVLEIWGTNSTLEEKGVKLELTAFDLHSNWTESWTKEVLLAPNSSTELYKGEAPGLPIRTNKSDIPRTVVLSARLRGDNGEVLGRYSNWYVIHWEFFFILMICVVNLLICWGSIRPEPFKFIKFPPVAELGLETTVAQDGQTVTLETRKPIKGIILDVDGEDVKWSDQAIDLVPGDPQVIKAVGLKGREIKLRFLGDGTA